jgi:quercetin dioxygenase-like cupin family protein
MNNGVVAAGEGRSIWVVGDRYTIKCSGNETGGAFAVIEAIVPAGNGPPPHIHSREDEAFYVLEGELQFHADGRSFAAKSGAWVTLARGSLHYFKNTGSKPARMLIVVTPSGLENFFLEVGREAIEGEAEPVTPTPEDIQKLVDTAPRYGLVITIPGEPDEE